MESGGEWWLDVHILCDIEILWVNLFFGDVETGLSRLKINVFWIYTVMFLYIFRK